MKKYKNFIPGIISIFCLNFLEKSKGNLNQKLIRVFSFIGVQTLLKTSPKKNIKVTVSHFAPLQKMLESCQGSLYNISSMLLRDKNSDPVSLH